MTRFLSVWTGTPFPLDMITSGSMSPTLMEGDIIAWIPVDAKDIEIGDVIVFKSYIHWPEEKLVVHRISDIKKDNFGNIVFETKGDANEWVDQAGPHIPEPYIREDHVLGKTISIGKQPLKIPFVGYLGIWINNGLDLLSQPSSSKGSLTYAGVFAPLTISSIILVVFLFLLPEKGKTIKEKLRFYIFGPKPVKLKRIIITFLVIYIVFLSTIHLFAHDSISSSLGINQKSSSSTLNFGRIVPGTSSFSKNLPVINPGAMPVKGIAFGHGEISKYVSKETFELDSGEYDEVIIRASAPNWAKNGSYTGTIMVYSSPFWLIFPDDFIKILCDFNGDAAVVCLDVLVASFLTFITITSLVLISGIINGYLIWSINRSWLHISKILIKKELINRLLLLKRKIKKSVKRYILWITDIEIFERNIGEPPRNVVLKPIFASIAAVIPIIILIHDQTLIIVLSVLLSGLISYLISCKLRKRIVLTSLVAILLSTTYVIVYTNALLLTKSYNLIELLAVGAGATAVYLLLLSFLLIPLTLLSWFLVHLIRNIKEWKNPLLVLEGRCDL